MKAISIIACGWLLLLPAAALAQCFGTEQYPPSTVVPDASGVPTTISTQSWAGDYALVSLTAGHSYRFSSSVATDHITVSTAVASGSVAFGVQPVLYTAAATQVYYVHFHTNATCGVQQVLRTTQVQRVYCAAGTSNCGGSNESIVRVTIGAIDNFSNGCGPGGYSDFTGLVTNMFIGQPVPITVVNSSPYNGDQVHVFVDWDRNFNFGDAGETFILSTTDNVTFSGTITAPPNALAGHSRMRVRLTWTGAVPACGNTTYGEVEDHTLNIQPAANSIFAGGNGRGDVQLAFSNGMGLAQYLGGDGRGDVQLAFSNSVGLAQYLGGNGRGDVQLAFSNALGFAQYMGGNGRGDVQLAFSNTLSLAQYLGGNGRGDVQLAFSNALGFAQYLGGNGRGDVQLAFSNALGFAQYMGGNGRGDVALSFTVVLPAEVFVSLRGVLEGPYNSSTGLMGDALRSLPSFPLSEPYTALGYTHVGGGGETVAPAVLAITGNNAIVDWVVVELRNAGNPATVVATRSALVQRDGDVVSVDGVSPVAFNLPSGSYKMALRHRNHLGVMTMNNVTLSSTATIVDLSAASTPAFGISARKSIAGTFPAEVLWAGDVNVDGTIRYTGQDNDRDPILFAIGGTIATNTVSGYLPSDVNLDGTAKYTGAGNDRDVILQNIGGVIATNTREEQMP